MTKSIYEELVAITEDYLGPAADRFIDRLVAAHLKKSPENLTAKDIPKLVQWLKLSMGLITNDRVLVDECEQRVINLADAK
jgi:hypothetical protein